MPKTYYLGKTKDGAAVARASGYDYGYTHAAVRGDRRKPGPVVALSDMTFSKSADGAHRGARQNWRRSLDAGETYEIVALEKVTAAAYKAATGKS